MSPPKTPVTPMTPWQRGDNFPTRKAGELLACASDVPPWDPRDRAAVWRRLQTNAASKPSVGPLLWVALAGSLCFLALAYVRARPQPASGAMPAVATAPAPSPGKAPTPVAADAAWTPISLGPVGQLRVHAATAYALPKDTHAEYRIQLSSGELCAEITHRDLVAQGPLVVQTPSAEVFVVGTQFCVVAEPGESRVSVSEGRVRVQVTGGQVLVGAGESIRTGSLHFGASRTAVPDLTPLPLAVSAAPAPVPAAPPPSALAEQNAVYARAIHARDAHDGTGALAGFRAYLAQYPTGLLAPEAHAGVLGELVAEGHRSEALREADEFLAAYPGDARAAEVAFIRGNLLRGDTGCNADALAAYQRALQLAVRPAVRDDALFAVGACEQNLGWRAQAKETFERYRRDFPQGTHAADVSKWVR